MSFLSMNFLLFLSVAILGYYVIPKRQRKIGRAHV